MRVAVASHIVIDYIKSEFIDTIALGGPSSYAGLTAKKMGADVILLTRYGKDLPEEYLIWYLRNCIRISKDAYSENNYTTCFQIFQNSRYRKIYLKKKCEDIILSEESLDGNAVIVSPVAGEISLKTLSELRKRFNLIYLDPQGFIRRFQPDGRCFLDNLDNAILNYVDVVKTDEKEAQVITGSRKPLKALEYLFEKGVKIAIYTRGSKSTILRCNEGIFKIPIVRKLEILDTTGAGDIFAGAYTVSYLQSKDPIWSGCLAVAASSIKLDKIGLSKISEIESVNELAEETRNKVERI